MLSVKIHTQTHAIKRQQQKGQKEIRQKKERIPVAEAREWGGFSGYEGLGTGDWNWDWVLGDFES